MRILLVEDTPDIALWLGTALRQGGMAVEFATDGHEADRCLQVGHGFDAVLLDLQLPDCDGLDWLAGQPELAEKSSVIVITSDGSIKRAIAAMRLGTYDFLVKPLAAERLLAEAAPDDAVRIERAYRKAIASA